MTILRAEAAALLSVLGFSAAAALAASWQPTAQFVRPSAVMAIAAVALAGAIITVLARASWQASALQAAPLRQRAAALRRKSRSAVFQRQLNPDAAGHTRARAPSAAPAAA
jgi:Family of unknown function (DUF6412)